MPNKFTVVPVLRALFCWRRES